MVPTVGELSTVINLVAVLVQPFAFVPVTVYVVVVAGDTLIVVPLSPPGCHVYVEPPVPVIEVETPLQIVVAVAVVPILGNEFTVMSLVDVFVQPVDVFVPVTVYVFASVTIIEAPDSAPGCQVYVFAPVPVMVAELPAQMLAEAGVTVVPTDGSGLTVTSFVEELLQPLALVPTTVYVVVASGETFTTVPVNPPGFQE